MDKKAYIEMSKIESDHWWFRSRRLIVEKIMNSYYKKSSIHILEVGSGTGGNSKLLKQYGILDNVEKNSLAIKLAKQKNPNDVYIKCDIPSQLDLIENHKYDLIVLLDVIEHIKEDLKTLKGLREKLKPKGNILITAPAFPFLWSQHDDYHHHFKRYKKTELLDLIKASGFNVRYSSYINFFLFIPISLYRLVAKIFKRSSAQNDELTNNKFFNCIFYKIFSFERRIIPYFKFPFGVSHLFVLKVTDK